MTRGRAINLRASAGLGLVEALARVRRDSALNTTWNAVLIDLAALALEWAERQEATFQPLGSSPET